MGGARLAGEVAGGMALAFTVQLACFTCDGRVSTARRLGCTRART
jgi:hypothetical protein